jgi:hypothetical protein
MDAVRDLLKAEVRREPGARGHARPRTRWQFNPTLPRSGPTAVGYTPAFHPSMVTPREEELLTGMGNCYAACHADFEETVGMVAGNRGLTPDAVKATLRSMRERFDGDPTFRQLRGRLPEEFPF